MVKRGDVGEDKCDGMETQKWSEGEGGGVWKDRVWNKEDGVEISEIKRRISKVMMQFGMLRKYLSLHPQASFHTEGSGRGRESKQELVSPFLV